MAKWTVKDWYQVEWDGEWLYGGDTFTAEPEDIKSKGLSQYVALVEEKAKEPAPNKAQTDTPNKARASSSRKTTKK